MVAVFGRIGNLLGLVGKLWIAVVLGTGTAIYGGYDLAANSSETGWFWVALGFCGVFLVALYVAYQALRERDEAQSDAAPAINFTGPTHFHLGGAPPASSATESSPAVPESKRIEIARLVTEHDAVIRGLTFVDKVIVGPAILVPVNDRVTAIESSLGTDADAVIWEIPKDRERLSGAIGLEDCTFIRCRFVHVGFGGPPEWAEQLRQQVPGARGQGSALSQRSKAVMATSRNAGKLTTRA